MATLAKLFVELGLIDKGFDAGIDKAEKKASRFGGVWKKAFLGIGAATAGGALAVGAGLLKIGTDFDSLQDTIRTGTGKTGKDLDALSQTALNVFKSIPTTMDKVGIAITEVVRRTGDTGTALEDLTRSELELSRITGEDLNGVIDATTKVFTQWGVATKDQVGTLDELFRASQATGIPVSQLAQELDQYGPILRQMGLGLDDSIALLSALDKAGIPAQQVIAGLRNAFKVFAKEGVADTGAALKSVFDQIKSAPTDLAASQLALKVFGTRAGPALADAIRSGALSYDDLLKIIQNGQDTIVGAAAATNDWKENLQILWNRVQVLALPLGKRLFALLGAIALGLLNAEKAFEDFRAKGISPFVSAVDVLQKELTRVFGAQTATSVTGAILDARDKIVPAFERMRAELPGIGSSVLKVGAVILRVLIPPLALIASHLDVIAPLVLGLVAGMKAAALAMKAFAAAEAIVEAVTAVLDVELSPLILIMAAIGAAVALFALAWYKNWFGIRQITAKVVGFVVKQFARFMAILRGGKGLHNALAGLPKPLQKVAILARRLVVLFGDLIHGRWDKVRGDLENIGRTLGNLFKSVGLKNFGQEFKREFDLVVKIVADVVTLVGDLIHGRWGKLWGDFVQIVKDLVGLGIEYFRMSFALWKDILTGLVALFNAIPWGTIWDAFKAAVGWVVTDGIPLLLGYGSQLIQALWDGATAVWAGSVRPWLHDRADAVLKAIGDLTDTLLGAGTALLTGAYKGITDYWNNTLSPWLSGVSGSIVSAIGDLGSSLYNAGLAVMQGLADGINWAWNNVVKPALDTITALIPSWKGPRARDLKLLQPSGRWIMGGLVSGIEGELPKLRRTLDGVTATVAGMGATPSTPSLASRAVVPAAAAIRRGNVSTTTNNGGPITFNIYDASDPHAVAEQVAGIFNRRIAVVRAGVA